MRPLVMDFMADSCVNNVSDQFLFGPALMVAPVYRYGDRSRAIYFPKGATWYDFYTNRTVAGGQELTVAAPYEQVPLYVRGGSILPMGPNMEWSDEKKPETLLLKIYAGADGQFTLYEDEGVNYNYEKGAYTMIHISYNEAERSVTIATRQGQFEGMLSERTFLIQLITPEGEKKAQVAYSGEAVTVKL